MGLARIYTGMYLRQLTVLQNVTLQIPIYYWPRKSNVFKQDPP